MKKIFNKEVLKKILIFFILLQPLLDTYILFDEVTIDIFGISPSTVIRLIFIVVMGVISIFVIRSKKQWKYYIIYIFLSLIYSVFHIYNALQFKSLTPGNFDFSIQNELFYIIRMIVPLFLIVVSSNLKFSKKEFLKIINILTLLISGTIVVTNIFKISIGSYITKPIDYNIFDWFIYSYKDFSVYDIGTRGYFSFANMISCILFGFNAILYYQFFEKQNLKTLFLIILQFLATFMLGTKVATVGFILSTIIMFIIYLFFCFIQKDLRFKPKALIFIGFIIIGWFVIYPFSPCNARQAADNKIADKQIPESELLAELKQVDKKLETMTDIEKRDYLVDYVYKNYKKFSIKEEYIIDKYPYNSDPIFWYRMFSEPFENKSSNRILTTNILNRMKEVNNNKISDELLGITYSRMSNVNILERDFVSQYYSLGILGAILFTAPYILIVLVGIVLIAMNYKKRTLNIENVSVLICLGSALFGSYYCGNSLDNLTLTIIYAFVFGYFIRNIFNGNRDTLKEDEVTILALHLGYGGVEQYISSLCKMLNGKYKINLISTYKVTNTPAFSFDKNIDIKYLINDKPNKEELKLAIKNKNIIMILKEGFKSLKILILKYYKNISAISSINSKYIITTRYFHNNLVKKYADNKIITIATEHNFHNNDKKYINKVIKSVEGFNYFVPVSDNLKNFYETKLKNTQCIFIPNVIEDNSSDISELKEDILINVGRMEVEKNQLELIEIVKVLKETKPDIKLYIIGDGSLNNELKNKVNEYNLNSTVIFTGFISKDELKKYYLKSKLFVMTSFTESFGLVLIEAQNYGVPCIAYDCADGAKEILKNDAGVLVKNKDQQKMISNILDLLNNEDKLKKLQEQGKKNSSRYHIDNVKDKWLELLGGKYEKNI